MRLLAPSLLLLTLLGCRTTPTEPPRKSGFLTDYARLEAGAPTTLRWLDEEALRGYTTFLFEPVQIYFHDEAREKGRDAGWKGLQDLRTYTQRAFQEALADGYTLVTQPGPGVARVRVALTDVDQTRPFLKLVTLGRDAGGASLEAEILDSETGVQLAAIVEVQKGSPVTMERFGPYDDARDIIDEWARRFRERLDALQAAAQ